MYFQSKKISPWTGKDYARIIIYFLANYVLLGGLFVLAIFFNCDVSAEKFRNYFSNGNGSNTFYTL